MKAWKCGFNQINKVITISDNENFICYLVGMGKQGGGCDWRVKREE